MKPAKKTKLKPVVIIVVVILILSGFVYQTLALTSLKQQHDQKKLEISTIDNLLDQTNQELTNLKNQDQYLINQAQQATISAITSTFKTTVDTYQDLLDLEPKVKDLTKIKQLFAQTLSYISDFNYASASASLKSLKTEITQTNADLAKSVDIPKSMANVAESSIPPNAGYSRQKVTTSVGSFIVSIVSADLSSTKVIVSTASNADCTDNCPVKSLSQYVSENGAFAGINGTYFCPSTYPDCQSKKNSFDLLVMNKEKTYLNSGNNVYSNNPGVIFGDNYIRFVTAISQWGRDTSVTGVLSNYPLLVFNKQVVFGGDSDPKKGSKGNRSFVSNIGNKVFIGVVHSATVAESAVTLQTLGMENALNLDDGGSTALWSGGYKVGPGRDLPNVILFTRK